MPDRIGLYLQDVHEISESIRYVQYAESHGFESVWQAESRLAREATIPMAAFAATTSRIKIGSGVINHWTRNVALIATTYLTLDDLAPERIILGIGTWWEPLAANVGIKRDKPLLAMREVVTTVRDLLAMKRVTFHGEFVNLTGIELDVTQGRKSPRYVPIYIGATGQKMITLAGEIADGVLLNYLVSPAHNAEALAALEQGAKVAGRSLESIDRPQLIVVSIDRDHKKALENARRLVTPYLVQQPEIMKGCGVPQELLDDLGRVLPWPATDEQIERAMTLVPDHVVQLITAAGTPEEVRSKVRDYVASGCTCPVLYPLSTDVRYLIDTFANGFS